MAPPVSAAAPDLLSRPITLTSIKENAAALQTGSGPQLIRIVISFEGRRGAGQTHPWHFRAGVDMHVGLQGRRRIERAHTNKTERRATAILAPERNLTVAAPEDPVRQAAIRWHGDGLRITREELHPIGFDQGIEHEG